MIKLLIVDDEPMICSLIQNLLEWDSLGYKIIGIANSGTVAHEMIRDCSPDVVISDIRMPGLDGLELIRKTVEECIQTEFILISGYRQFEYAQKAMKYGVKYYLLKPIDEEKLLEIAMEIKHTLEQKKEQLLNERILLSRVDEVSRKAKRRFLKSIFHIPERIPDYDYRNMAYVNQEYDTTFQEGRFLALFVSLHLNENINIVNESFLGEFEKRLHILKKHCYEYLYDYLSNGLLVLVNYTEGNQNSVEQLILSIHQNIQEYISQFKDFTFFLGIGTEVHAFEEISLTVQSALKARRYSVFLPKETLAFYSHYSYPKIPFKPFYTENLKNSFRSYLQHGDTTKLEPLVRNALFELYFDRSQHSPLDLFELADAFIQELFTIALSVPVREEVLSPIREQWAILQNYIVTYEELSEDTIRIIQRIGRLIQEESANKEQKPIRIMKEYLEAHFMEDVSLHQLADLVAMNSSYVSSIFKKETGVAYTEYLTSCRMKHACMLLTSTNNSILEIACACGYQDARYFSKIFSKSIGLKPSEYRKLYS